MKQNLLGFIKNTFLTTGISLSLLSVIAMFMGGHAIFLQTVWQSVLANACVHIAMGLTRRWESPYFLLDAAVDVTVVTLLLLGFGYLFGWFSSTPFYVLIPMAVIVYTVGSLFQIFRVRQDIMLINRKLHQRNAGNN